MRSATEPAVVARTSAAGAPQGAGAEAAGVVVARAGAAELAAAAPGEAANAPSAAGAARAISAAAAGARARRNLIARCYLRFPRAILRRSIVSSYTFASTPSS